MSKFDISHLNNEVIQRNHIGNEQLVRKDIGNLRRQHGYMELYFTIRKKRLRTINKVKLQIAIGFSAKPGR